MGTGPDAVRPSPPPARAVLRATRALGPALDQRLKAWPLRAARADRDRDRDEDGRG